MNNDDITVCTWSGHVRMSAPLWLHAVESDFTRIWMWIWIRIFFFHLTFHVWRLLKFVHTYLNYSYLKLWELHMHLNWRKCPHLDNSSTMSTRKIIFSCEVVPLSSHQNYDLYTYKELTLLMLARGI